jgi:hypothetical protein
VVIAVAFASFLEGRLFLGVLRLFIPVFAAR